MPVRDVWGGLRKTVRDRFSFAEIKDLAGDAGMPVQRLAHLQQGSSGYTSKGQLMDAIDGLFTELPAEQQDAVVSAYVQQILVRYPDLRDELASKLSQVGLGIDSNGSVIPIRAPSRGVEEMLQLLSQQDLRRNREIQDRILEALNEGRQGVPGRSQSQPNLGMVRSQLYDKFGFEPEEVQSALWYLFDQGRITQDSSDRQLLVGDAAYIGGTVASPSPTTSSATASNSEGSPPTTTRGDTSGGASSVDVRSGVRPARDAGRAMTVTPAFDGRGFVRDTSRVFVLCPFHEPFNTIYTDHIKWTVESLGLICSRADDIYDNTPIMEDVWRGINEAGIIISDLTGRNANVFYETGIAHAIGKEVILISQSSDDVPFDLRHRRFFPYNDTYNGSLKLREDLRRIITTIRQRLTP